MQPGQGESQEKRNPSTRAQIVAFAEFIANFNDRCYPKVLGDMTPADVFNGAAE